MALEIKTTILQQLLEADGIKVPTRGGAEKQMTCFNPFHKDSSPSMSVNVAKGIYHCHGCGISGNAFTYLSEIRGYDTKQAVECLKEHGATETVVNSLEQMQRKAVADRKRLPYNSDTIPETLRVNNIEYKATQKHEYRKADGTLAKVVMIYTQPPETVPDGKKPRKEPRPFTPRSQGGWWWADCINDKLPERDRSFKTPLYDLPRIAQFNKQADDSPKVSKMRIWLVEGEKCVDAIKNCVGLPNNQPPPITTMSGGCNASKENNFLKHDLSPLYGRRILLVADGDSEGRSHMRRVGLHLTAQQCDVQYLLPPGSDHYDIADAATRGWPGVIEWFKDCGGTKTHQEANVNARTPPKPMPKDFMVDTQYFRVLGQETDCIIIQSKNTSKLHRIKMTSLANEGNLISIAPLHFWLSLTDGQKMDASHRLIWADSMIRASEDLGEMRSTSKTMWQVGAVRISKTEIMYNIGDGVLESDEDGLLTRKTPLTKANESRKGHIFLPGEKIRVRIDDSAADKCRRLYDALQAYRWEKPEHGMAFTGWLATSLIGGCLPFRPMLWLTAEAGAGKTFLFKEVIKSVMGHCATDLADATEAGIAGVSMDSALPVYLDEFEPEKGREQRHANILSLIRVATSGDAGRARGTSIGGFTMLRPRFSLMLGSINRQILNEANDSRLWPISLSPRGVPNWPTVRDNILSATEPESALAIRSRIIINASRIAAEAREIEDYLLNMNVKTREAQIRSALSAGVRFFSGDKDLVLQSRDRSTEGMYRAMATLLSTMLRNEDGTTVALSEALFYSAFDVNCNFIDPLERVGTSRDYTNLTNRYGFVMSEEGLYAAMDYPAMSNLLERSEFGALNLTEYFLTLPGVTKSTRHSRIRKKFAGLRKDCVLISRPTLELFGFFDVDQTKAEPEPRLSHQDREAFLNAGGLDE